MIRQLYTAGWDINACLNVNFPDVAPAEAGPLTLPRQGMGIVKGVNVVPRTDPRGLTYHWLQFHREEVDNAPDTETAMVRAGAIAVTPLRFERTNEDTLTHLRDSLVQR